jgi:type 1 glutamine amidotransferase
MILKSAKPDGPFELVGPDAGTPAEQRALDGTPFVERGENWLVYCHEWDQVGDGKILAVKMKSDWSGRDGDPITLFKASDAAWGVETTFHGKTGRVTDGPCLYRTRDGRLLMLWSSFTGEKKSYAIGLAESMSGRLQGPWRQQPQPWLSEHGGHCMMFTNFAGQLMLTWHQPNDGNERAHFKPIAEVEGTLKLLAPGESVVSAARWSANIKGKRVLLVGGGKHHDYPQWFNETDAATLRAAGFDVLYTCEPETATRLLPSADALVFSSGLGWPATAEFRAAYEQHRAAGKGIVGLHSGLWINWRDWPQHNRGFGLAVNSHPPAADYTITKLIKDHPLSAALPDTFVVTDELYHVESFPQGAPVKVIAETSPSPKTNKRHASFWYVDEPSVRVACIVIGHDGRTHTTDVFKKLLTDTVRWAAAK